MSLAGRMYCKQSGLLSAMLVTAIFDHLFFIKKSNISATDRLVVVLFQTNIANRWLFMTQRKILANILYS